MSQYSLLPITYSEFRDWYNRRSKQFLGLRLIPAEAGPDVDDLHLRGEWKDVMVDTIPEYDEDFQVVLALVEDVAERKYREVDTGEAIKQGAAVQQIDISDLARLYPLTERGGRLLESRLEDNIQLGPPFFESEIEMQDRRRNRQQAREGGDALLKLYEMREFRDSAIDSEAREKVLDAVHTKVRGNRSGDYSSMIASVIEYDRHDKPEFPSTSLGNVYDYFSIVRVQHQRKCPKDEYQKVLEEVLKPAQDVLNRVGREMPACEVVCEEELSQSFHRLETMSPLDIGTCPPRAGIMFLNLRDELRRSTSIHDTSVEAWARYIRDDHRLEFTIGLWMIGAFFDFSTFADEYYELIKPQFMY
jgi:hypothetical protein